MSPSNTEQSDSATDTVERMDTNIWLRARWYHRWGTRVRTDRGQQKIVANHVFRFMAAMDARSREAYAPPIARFDVVRLVGRRS